MIDYNKQCPIRKEVCIMSDCILWGWVSTDFMKEHKGCKWAERFV